jgi:SH3-like domain-containing protein
MSWLSSFAMTQLMAVFAKNISLGYIMIIFVVLFSLSAHAVTFVSLKSSEINLRVGPGKEYPIVWIIMKRNLPAILVAEFDQWRKVKLFDDTEGWVHKNMISGKNTIIVVTDNEIMYNYASCSHPIAKVEKNVVMRVVKIEADWIKVEINRWKGWVERKNVWGMDDT